MTNVKRSLEGADWAHMALHGDLETDSLVLAIPRSSADQSTHVKVVVSLPCVHWKSAHTISLKRSRKSTLRLPTSSTRWCRSPFPRSPFPRSRRALGLKLEWVFPAARRGTRIQKRLTELAIKRELASKSGPAAQEMLNISIVEAAAVVADLSMLARGAGKRGSARRAAGAWNNRSAQCLQHGTGRNQSRGRGRRCAASIAAEEERRQYWREFCKRDVDPTCVLHFPVLVAIPPTSCQRTPNEHFGRLR